ncbi:MAG TPA: metallophosphoesterase [Candidatus Angelobacter sp.]|nr:metallophosphoesterase [Candidatus Angelobacter sp.]
MRRSVSKELNLVILAFAVATTAQMAVGANRAAQVSTPSSLTAWVELGADGEIIARVITTDLDCPFIKVDHSRHQMLLRAAPETVPQRPTTSPPSESKPSEFPVTTCEYSIPRGTRVAAVIVRHQEDNDGAKERERGDGEDREGHSVLLPLPKRNPHRIVILGDTGCRLKIGDPFQACFDPVEWPLQTIARTAAEFHPDLVLHVGDYHYRENKCPPDIGGCQGSPWGYGWDVWQADLFQPAEKLLAAAPWIMVRGNHEECARAGQGWYRFLDTRPYEPARTCNDPKFDDIANFNDPYAVPIGKDAQVIVFDSSKVAKTKLKPTDPAFTKYKDELNKVEALVMAKPDVLSIWTNHHPLLAFSPLPGNAVTGGNPALLSVMFATYGKRYYPPGISLVFNGHTHILEALSFSTDHPATLMSGNGGDNLDLNLPDPFPANAHPDSDFANAVDVEQIAHTSTFGFAVADRGPAGTWKLRAFTRDGHLLTKCTFAGSKMSCSKTGFLH